MLLTLAGPYVFKILKSFILWFWMWYDEGAKSEEEHPLLANDHDQRGTPSGARRRSVDPEHRNGPSAQAPYRRSETEDGGSSEAVGTMPNDQESNQARHRHNPYELFSSSRGGRETLGKFVKNALQRGADFSASHALIMTMIGVLVLTVFVAQVVANVFSARIATDRAAILASSHCGIWQLDEDVDDEAASRADLRDLNKESRAGEYARNCYSSEDSNDFKKCDFFYQPKIDFKTKTQDICPFASKEICGGGRYSAISFDTGLVSLNSLGINSDIDYKFRRKTSCAPLSLDYPFVQSASSNDTENFTFHYHYGSALDEESCSPIDTNYTFKTSGRPFDWLTPGYSVKSVSCLSFFRTCSQYRQSILYLSLS